MNELEQVVMQIRMAKVEAAYLLLQDVASTRHRWTERMEYAVEWLKGIEREMDEYSKLKRDQK